MCLYSVSPELPGPLPWGYGLLWSPRNDLSWGLSLAQLPGTGPLSDTGHWPKVTVPCEPPAWHWVEVAMPGQTWQCWVPE